MSYQPVLNRSYSFFFSSGSRRRKSKKGWTSTPTLEPNALPATPLKSNTTQSDDSGLDSTLKAADTGEAHSLSHSSSIVRNETNVADHTRELSEQVRADSEHASSNLTDNSETVQNAHSLQCDSDGGGVVKVQPHSSNHVTGSTSPSSVCLVNLSNCEQSRAQCPNLVDCEQSKCSSVTKGCLNGGVSNSTLSQPDCVASEELPESNFQSDQVDSKDLPQSNCITFKELPQCDQPKLAESHSNTTLVDEPIRDLELQNAPINGLQLEDGCFLDQLRQALNVDVPSIRFEIPSK